MKKFISMIVVVLAMTISLTGCKSADDRLRDAVAECNNDCPQEVDNGIFILSFELNGKSVEMNVALDRDIYGVASLEDYSNAIGGEMEKVLTAGNDDDIEALVNACRKTNRGFVVNVMWTDEDDDEVWEYRIRPEDL